MRAIMAITAFLLVLASFAETSETGFTDYQVVKNDTLWRIAKNTV